jgi:hypothetical protein
MDFTRAIVPLGAFLIIVPLGAFLIIVPLGAFLIIVPLGAFLIVVPMGVFGTIMPPGAVGMVGVSLSSAMVWCKPHSSAQNSAPLFIAARGFDLPNAKREIESSTTPTGMTERFKSAGRQMKTPPGSGERGGVAGLVTRLVQSLRLYSPSPGL